MSTSKRYTWLAKGRAHECVIAAGHRTLVAITPDGRTHEGDTPEECMDLIAGVFSAPLQSWSKWEAIAA